MTIITTRNDLTTYVHHARPDFVEHGLADQLVAALQAADHPAWGRDWSDWLGSDEVESICREVAASDTEARRTNAVVYAWTKDACGICGAPAVAGYSDAAPRCESCWTEEALRG